MTAERDEDRIERLTDALVDEVLNRSDDRLLDEVAAAYGDRQALAMQFDNLIDPILKQTAIRKSDDWLSFDLQSRPLVPHPATPTVPPELQSIPRSAPPFRRINTRLIALSALLITIVASSISYYISKTQVETDIKAETAKKIQEIEQRKREVEQQNREIEQRFAGLSLKIQEIEQEKREIQRRFAVLSSEVELRRKEEPSLGRQASRALPTSPPSPVAPPLATASPSPTATPQGLPSVSPIAPPQAFAPPSSTVPPSLTIRAPVQLKSGGNFVQLFFLAQQIDDVREALRRIQPQFPKQVQNAGVFLQADMSAKDHFYGIQIGTFETAERADQACGALRRPGIQCFVQSGGPVAPQMSLGALMPPSAGAIPSPTGAPRWTPVGSQRGAK